jgi:hypothetical protein
VGGRGAVCISLTTDEFKNMNEVELTERIVKGMAYFRKLKPSEYTAEKVLFLQTLFNLIEKKLSKQSEEMEQKVAELKKIFYEDETN